MRAGSDNRARREAAIRDELAGIIAREVKDPRVRDAGIVSVNTVELNKDGSVAQVYVSFVHADDRTRDAALAGLGAAARFLRGALAKRLRLGRAPSLRFAYDVTAEFGEKLSRIVAEDSMTPFERVVELLGRADKILVTAHRGPDGDATGSMIALVAMLREQGRTVTLYTPDLLPRNLKWLPHARTVVRKLKKTDRFEATVVVDCGDAKLLGDEFPAPEVTGTVVALDHHASNRPFGDIFYSDPQAASVGVLVVRLAKQLGWPISRDAAQGIWVSMIADTGSFRYSNSNAEAFRIAAELVEAGDVEPWAVSERMHEEVPPSRYRLLSAALASLELVADGKLAFITIPEEMVKAAKATWEDSEGIVNYARAISGVECGVLLSPAKGGGIRVSLRSRGRAIDAGVVCAGLGGGGHPGAAGCRLEGDLGAARKVVEQALVEALKSDD